MAENKLNFEQVLGKLEKTVKNLESGDLSLDEVLSLFEEGVSLVKTCHQRLEEAEQKVEVLVRSMVERENKTRSEGCDDSHEF